MMPKSSNYSLAVLSHIRTANALNGNFGNEENENVKVAAAAGRGSQMKVWKTHIVTTRNEPFLAIHRKNLYI